MECTFPLFCFLSFFSLTHVLLRNQLCTESFVPVRLVNCLGSHHTQTLGHAEHSLLFDVLKLMEEWSIKPNEMTYELIITRLSANGRLELGLQYLSQLGPAGLSPRLDTAAALITCAARLGYPRLALDLADAFERTSVRRLDNDVWVDILGSCAEALFVSLVLPHNSTRVTYCAG